MNEKKREREKTFFFSGISHLGHIELQLQKRNNIAVVQHSLKRSGLSHEIDMFSLYIVSCAIVSLVPRAGEKEKQHSP